jgi:hypothetical protein
MGVVVGPVLMRPGGYAFDIWAVEHGVSHGYLYRRIEDANHARKAEINRAVTGSGMFDGSEPCEDICICTTLEQFMTELIERGVLVTDSGLRALYTLQAV